MSSKCASFSTWIQKRRAEWCKSRGRRAQDWRKQPVPQPINSHRAAGFSWTTEEVVGENSLFWVHWWTESNGNHRRHFSLFRALQARLSWGKSSSVTQTVAEPVFLIAPSGTSTNHEETAVTAINLQPASKHAGWEQRAPNDSHAGRGRGGAAQGESWALKAAACDISVSSLPLLIVYETHIRFSFMISSSEYIPFETQARVSLPLAGVSSSAGILGPPKSDDIEIPFFCPQG